jgi:vesicle-fusing ATPase
MKKEIALGAASALLIVLIWHGVNILPLLFFFFLLGSMYYFFIIKNGPENTRFNILEKESVSVQVDFSSIGGQKTAKKELLEALDFVRHPERVARMGIRPLKGILLVGPPGTGKTLLAKAAATYTDSVFLAASGSEFIEMYAGVGAQRVRQIFSKARSMAARNKKKSAIIFIDEIEILGGSRGSHTSHHEYDQTLNQLLVEMDGITEDSNVRILLIGATNRADMLDKALLRPGRFDRIVPVELPDKEDREEILGLYVANKPLADDVELGRLAGETFGFSGAHLESLANEAAILAMREGCEKICQRHFSEAIDKVIMGEKLERKPVKEEMRRIAVHEIGHAVISEIINPGSVSAVTTTPRGKALGYTRQSPQNDSYLYTKDYLNGQIAVLLAGAAAEEIVFGSRSTGAAGDYKQAVDIARQLIACGMSSLGVVSVENLPGDLLHKELQKLIVEQEEKVKKLLGENRILINRLAENLLAEEKIGGDILRLLMKEEGLVA